MLIKDESHRWILEITVTLMMVTNSQGTQPPCMGLKRKILRQNWEKGVRVGLHCLQKQSELEMGDKGKVIAVLGFAKAQKQKKNPGLLQEVARFRDQGDNLSARDVFRLAPSTAFGVILVKQFVFPRLPSFPGLLF